MSTWMERAVCDMEDGADIAIGFCERAGIALWIWGVEFLGWLGVALLVPLYLPLWAIGFARRKSRGAPPA